MMQPEESKLSPKREAAPNIWVVGEAGPVPRWYEMPEAKVEPVIIKNRSPKKDDFYTVGFMVGGLSVESEKDWKFKSISAAEKAANELVDLFSSSPSEEEWEKHTFELSTSREAISEESAL